MVPFSLLWLPKLKAAELQVSELQSTVNDLLSQNSILKRQIPSSDSPSCSSSCQHKLEAESLKKKIIEMEQFFSDYNLKWVGSSAPKLSIDQIDIPRLQKVIATLNSKINSSRSVSKDNNISQLGDTKAIQLCLYKDGLTLRGGLLRPFGSPCLYFPSELKDAFPTGVLIDLVDRSELNYSDWVRRVEKHSKLSEFGAEKPLTFDELIDRLPKSVIKNGNIISVKNDVIEAHKSRQQSSLSQAPSEKPIPKLEGVHDSKDAFDLVSDAALKGLSQSVELNIKFNSKMNVPLISDVFRLKVVESDTISTVYCLLKDFLETIACPANLQNLNFELFRPIPRQVFEHDCSDTLLELGLTPKAVLFCRHKL
ncbi:hypothetical protein GEMRC1_013891 [Eukaryota sp. GEM-RC1]